MSFSIPTSPVPSPRSPSVSCKGSLEALNPAPSSPSSPAPSSPIGFRSQRVSNGPRPIYAGLDSSPLPPPVAEPLNSCRRPQLRWFGNSSFPPLSIPPVHFTNWEAPRSDGMKEVVSESATCSVYCMRGRGRMVMEDRYKMALDINGDPKLAFFGVFDGHRGKTAAEFASENIGKIILEEVSAISEDSHSELENAVKMAYLRTDSDFLKEEMGYMRTDLSFGAEEKKMRSGTCCVTALVRNGNIVVSNAGDCRAVLSCSGRAEALTSDHKATRDDEKCRIKNLGGWVFNCDGTWRVQGDLAVTRGIGDSHMKEFIIAEPETKIISIEDDCEFLILASDGLWDQVGNQEAVDIVRSTRIGSDNPSSLSACRRLADLSASRGSRDDISVMVIELRQFA